MTGSVSNVVTAKRFGFISGESGEEYFFHKEDMISDWDELVADFNNGGAGKVRVEFRADKTPKGPRARNVAVIEG